MGRRRVLMTIAALLAAFVLVVSGCGGKSSEPELTGTDNEEAAPPEAQDAIINGLETMFTWFPVRDASPMDAYNRALPFLGTALRDGANNRIERGNSVWWQEWKTKRAEVTADALLVAGEHPTDTPDTVQRAVILTQTVKTPAGQQVDQTTMRIERVVAKKTPDGWRVEEINFFPENEFRTQTCPPGQSHQPPPDGPCAPIPPPPMKQCPDGSTVAPDQICPEPPPVTTTTTTTPTATTPPTTTTTPPTQQCPDGSTIPADQTCPTPPPTPCPDGSSVPAGETCPPVTCPDGSTVPNGEQCPIRIPCPDGSSVPLGQACPPVQCPDGSTVTPPMPCPIPIPCPDGSSVPLGQVCPPVDVRCPEGWVPSPIGCIPYVPGTIPDNSLESCCSSPNSWRPSRDPWTRLWGGS